MSRPSSPATCDVWDPAACEGTPYCPPRCPRFFDGDGAPVRIRTLEPDDVDRLVRMYDSLDGSSRTMGLPPVSRDEIRAWIERLDEDGWNLVALRDGTAVGHVGVVPTDGDGPKFVIFVDDDFQGRGIGTELVKQVVAYAADREYDELVLTVSEENERAIGVYEDLGFEPDGESGDPTNLVAMSLPLSKPIADRVRLPPADR